MAKNGHVLARSIASDLSDDDKASNDIETKMRQYNKNICLALAAALNLIFRGDVESESASYDDNLKFVDEEARSIKDYNKGPKYNNLREEIDDGYIGTHVQQRYGNDIVEGIVSSMRQTPDGEKLMVVPNDNSILDTRIDNIIFPDGFNEEYS